MELSFYIKKYIKVFIGRNDMTVNQNEGQCYSKDKVEGYYNNLTEKITRFGFPDNSIPQYEVAPGVKYEFSIGVFQYGLAAYDLYLLTKEQSYLSKLKACADWAVEHQEKSGAWATFTYKRPDQLYSSMAQGEGVSLLIRAHIAFNDDKYVIAAHKAKSFMMTPMDKGGTAVYKDDDIYLYEYLNSPLVLNGWIFSAWGLFDYAKYFHDTVAMREWNIVVNSIAKKLPEYDRGYWSMYNDGGGMANPFYHKLHIAQLNTMYDLTGIDAYKTYRDIFCKYQSRRLNRIRAFIFKIRQKIAEK